MIAIIFFVFIFLENLYDFNIDNIIVTMKAIDIFLIIIICILGLVLLIILFFYVDFKILYQRARVGIYDISDEESSSEDPLHDLDNAFDS